MCWGDKNEILYSEFGVNYNKEPDQLKKGTTIIKRKQIIPMENGETKVNQRTFKKLKKLHEKVLKNYYIIKLSFFTNYMNAILC